MRHVVGIVLASLLWAVPAHAAEGLVSVDVALGEVSINKVPFLMAADNGIYERNGLDIHQFITPNAAEVARNSRVVVPPETVRQDIDAAPIAVGAGADAVPNAPNVEFASRRTPAETLSEYFSAMSARNDNPNLEIYTQPTQRMLQTWIMTPAQMDNVVGTYRRCRPEPTRFSNDGRRAVIRYPAGERNCASFFFESDSGTWALDLTMMQNAIRFGRSNAWRFDPAVEHPYAFGFDDWRFDRNGFPN